MLFSKRSLRSREVASGPVFASTLVLLVLAIVGTFPPLKSSAVLGASSQVVERAQTSVIPIPQSLQTEHQEIHEALMKAAGSPGRVGSAAKELAAVLDPHFARENEIALPPLGLLAPLAAGDTPARLQEALAMTDALRRELPRMLEEHKRIRAAATGAGCCPTRGSLK